MKVYTGDFLIVSKKCYDDKNVYTLYTPDFLEIGRNVVYVHKQRVEELVNPILTWVNKPIVGFLTYLQSPEFDEIIYLIERL